MREGERMRNISAIIGLLMLSGCSHGEQQGKPLVCDPSLAPYVQSFQADSLATAGHPSNVNNLTIGFSAPRELLNENKAAVCEKFQDGHKAIRIDPTWWSYQTETSKQSAIYHELGHCVLNRDHKSDRTYRFGSWTPEGGNNTVYVSVMNMYSLVDGIYYPENRQAYMNELFLTK